jgi:hypothetical protein
MYTLVQLSSQAVVQRSSTLLAAELDGETMLLSIEHGRYYGLDAVGGDIWRRLETPISVGDLCAALRDVYEADPMVIEREVLELLNRLRD